MKDFTRGVAWRLWAFFLLMFDTLIHMVRAATIEDQSAYQSCLANPSTCTILCASLRLPFSCFQTRNFSSKQVRTPERSVNDGWVPLTGDCKFGGGKLGGVLAGGCGDEV